MSFSQLFRNVLQPLKLEIGRSASIDWLAFLLFRFKIFLVLLPQNVDDLQFALRHMSVLKEKCEWLAASHVREPLCQLQRVQPRAPADGADAVGGGRRPPDAARRRSTRSESTFGPIRVAYCTTTSADVGIRYLAPPRQRQPKIMPVSAMLARLDLSEDALCGMNEV